MRRRIAKAKRCAKTGKVSYRDEKSALAVAKRTDWPDPDHAPIRAYPCEFCPHWHLTSREERPPDEPAHTQRHPGGSRRRRRGR